MTTTAARKAACVLLAWALAAAGLSVQGSARAPLARPQREFDYFALALQWPGTICASTRHCCAKNGCCRYVPRVSSSPHAPNRWGSNFRFRYRPKMFSPPLCAMILSSAPLCSSEPLRTFTIRKCSIHLPDFGCEFHIDLILYCCSSRWAVAGLR
jgi:hypothetical protein